MNLPTGLIMNQAKTMNLPHTSGSEYDEKRVCEGNLRYLGSDTPNEIDFVCPDSVVWFKLSGIKQE
jgi:hypothetical protein